MIGWPGPLMIAAAIAILIFYYMRRSLNTRRDERSERLQRHREYYDALMRRDKGPEPPTVSERNKIENESDDPDSNNSNNYT
jgi:hypothetical protein